MLKRTIVLLVATLMLALPFAGVLAQDGTIVDIAAGNEDFSTLVALVQAAGLAETLSSEGPFTVFAPTNDAFAALPDFVVEYLTSEAGAETLASILTYHVVPGAVMAADVTALADGTEVETVQGGTVVVSFGDMGEVMVDDATVVNPDIEASNGVIHVIDSVMLPEIELDMVIPADVIGDIVTAGSSTVGPLSQVIQENFVNEGYTSSISNSIIGSGAGIERFCVAGETDIANASRPIRESEIESCQQLTPPRNPIEIRVGTDALAVVVNPANDFASSLTLEQLAVAFSTAETWADVDPSFPEEPILRFIPGTDSGTFDYFVEEVFEEDEAPILAAANVQLSEDDNVLLEGVANNQYAIGFFGFAYYAQNEGALKILSIEDVAANAANVDNGTYPLARPLFIYSDAGIIQAKPQVGAFISYYLQTVNDVIGQVGYFPANATALNLAKLEVKAVLAQSM